MQHGRRYAYLYWFGWLIALMFWHTLACADNVETRSPTPRIMLQESDADRNAHTATLIQYGDHPATQLDHAQTQRRTLEIIAGSALVVGAYGKVKWWQNGFSGNFTRQNEGWFGRNTYSGGADKLGHFFMNYAGTRLATSAFEWAGNDREHALDLAFLTTLGIFTAVEVADGFAKQWHFSKEDASINAFGAGAGLLFEKNPQLDRILDMRIQYWPSKDNGSRFEPFGDYSGQTYLLVGKASGVPALREHPWLRYVEVAVGYGTRGYSSNHGQINAIGTRNVYWGISLNLSEVLEDTVFKRSSEQNLTRRATNTFLEYVQVPGTAALAKHPLHSD